MANFNHESTEPRKTPAETGRERYSKKRKKKTTRIPLPVEKPVKPDTDASKIAETKDTADKKTTGLEDIFVRPKDKEESDEQSDNKNEDKVEESEADGTAKKAEKKTEEQPQPAGPEDTPLIFSREKDVETPTEATSVSQAQSSSLPGPEAPKAPQVEFRPEMAIFAQKTEVTQETGQPAPSEAQKPTPEAPAPPVPGPEEVVPKPDYFEALPAEQAIAERYAMMIDPSDRIGEDESANHHHVETVKPITERDVDDAYYQGKKRGNSQGVLAGGVAGYWLGSRKRKEAEGRAAKAEKAAEKQGKEIEQLKADKQLVSERLKVIKNIQEQVPKNIKEKLELPQVPSRSEAVPQAAPAEAAPVPKAPEVPPPLLFPAAVAAEAVRPKTVESIAPTTPEIAKPEQKKPVPTEVLPEEKEITEETYKTEAGKRRETSAWHSYEVDKVTGQLAEAQSKGYGEAFRQEQQQEKLQREAAQAQAAVQLGHAVVQGVQEDKTTTQKSPAPAKPAKPSKKFGISPQDAAYIKQQMVKRTTSPATWVIALLLVTILYFIFR